MPETPFFDQAAPTAARGRTAPDRLDGTVALVTGASSGIGAATAIALAAEGAAVAVAALAATRRLPPGPSVVKDRQVEALGIGAAGFGEGMVGAVPDVAGHDAE